MKNINVPIIHENGRTELILTKEVQTAINKPLFDKIKSLEAQIKDLSTIIIDLVDYVNSIDKCKLSDLLIKYIEDDKKLRNLKFSGRKLTENRKFINKIISLLK